VSIGVFIVKKAIFLLFSLFDFLGLIMVMILCVVKNDDEDGLILLNRFFFIFLYFRVI